MASSYAQNTANTGEIHGTVNLPFQRPVHEGYIVSSVRPWDPQQRRKADLCPANGANHANWASPSQLTFQVTLQLAFAIGG